MAARWTLRCSTGCGPPSRRILRASGDRRIQVIDSQEWTTTYRRVNRTIIAEGDRDRLGEGWLSQGGVSCSSSCPRLDERRTVPGEQASRHERGRGMGECLGTVVRAEDVGLVGQQHEVDVVAVDLGQLHAGVALRVVGEDVAPAEPGDTSPVNVSLPTTIHGSRQIGTATRAIRRRQAAGPRARPRPARPARPTRARPRTAGASRRTPRPGCGSVSPTRRCRPRAAARRRARGSPPGWRRRGPARARRSRPGRGSWCRARGGRRDRPDACTSRWHRRVPRAGGARWPR